MEPKIIGASYNLPAGTYYVGDPCYVVPDELWDEYLHVADVNPSGLTIQLSDGRLVAAVTTCWGDGVYADQQNRTYPVDAGMLGAVQALEGDAPAVAFLSNVVTFPNSFDVVYNEGLVIVGHIKINTDPHE